MIKGKQLIMWGLGWWLISFEGYGHINESQKVESTTFEKTEDTEKTIHTPLPSDVRLIIYSSNATVEAESLCLVKEIRKVSLVEGHNKLILQEIPQKFLEDSLLIRSLEDLPLIFTEFSFHSDLLTFENLLEKSVGEEVFVIFSPLSKENHKIALARLLAIEKDQALVQLGSRIEIVSRDQIAFHSIPPSLSLYPLLHVNVKSPGTQSSQLELTYMTKGLSWDAKYTVEVDSKRNQANMMGWVAIKNTSGVNFHKAHIQLAPAHISSTSGNSTPSSSQLYPLPLPTSLYHDTTKKVAFLSANNINISREYRIDLPPISYFPRESHVPLETKIWFAIRNSRQNNLGFLLPPGEIKIYARDLKHMRYAGTIPIKHTNVSEFISIPVETCHLITAQIQQIDFKQLGSSIMEVAFRVSMTNKNPEPLKITLMQKLPPDAVLTRNSIEKHTIVDNTIFWPIEIPSNQTVSLRYRVRMMREKEASKTGVSPQPIPQIAPHS